jgi:hypothetical protein
MNRSVLFSALGALTCLALVILFIKKTPSEPTPPTAAPSIAVAPLQPKTAAIVTKPSETGSSPTPQLTVKPRAISTELRNDFRDSTNLASFIQNALAKRSSGGTFYAGLAMSECMANIPRLKEPFADLPSVDDSVRQDVKSARARTIQNQTRCAGVESQFGDLMSLAKVIYSEGKTTDPLQLVASTSRERPIESLRVARDIGDVNLINSIVSAEGIKVLDYLQPGYSINKPESVLRAAAVAVGCDYSEPCWSHEQMAAKCAFRAECAVKTLDDVARKEYPPEILAVYFETKSILAPLFIR